MVLDAAGLSSQSRTRVRTAEDRTREAWQPWRGWRVESRSELTSLPCKVAFRAVFPKNSQPTTTSATVAWGPCLYTLTRICPVEYIKRVESVFEIIAEPNRRAILSLLVSKQQSVGRDRSSTSYAAADRIKAPASAARGRFRGIHGGRTAPSLPAEARTASGGGCLAGSVPPVLVRSRGCSRTPPRPHGSVNTNEKGDKEKTTRPKPRT